MKIENNKLTMQAHETWSNNRNEVTYTPPELLEMVVAMGYKIVGVTPDGEYKGNVKIVCEKLRCAYKTKTAEKALLVLTETIEGQRPRPNLTVEDVACESKSQVD